VQDESLAQPQPSSAKQNLETCAINAGCSDTGLKNCKKSGLKTSLSFWKNINTSEFIIDIIKSGN
jgi:hypothetical protein